jgi:hypothetical protein
MQAPQGARNSLQMADASGSASPESGCVPSGSELVAAKRNKYKAERDKTRISLFEHFERWRDLRKQINLKADKELAGVLLDSYFENKGKAQKR